MDDEPSATSKFWLGIWHPDHQRFVSQWLVTTLLVAAAVWLMPWLSFVFGTGTFSLVFGGLLFFGFLLLFKSLIFKDLLSQKYDDATTHILEYHQGSDDEEEEATAEILENALQMREIRAIDCMTPRSQVVQVSADVQHDILRTVFYNSKLSRILVNRAGEPNNIIGYVHVQQMLGQIPAGQLQQSMLQVDKVASDTLVNDLLSRFVRQRRNIACVVDAEGQWIGIVTLEDVLEQLFGEIEDEYD
jgi:CBS domain containing-hemolysin-like protein